MIRSRLEAEKCFKAGEKLNFLFFWGHQPSKDGKIGPSCLSQWWPAPFVVNNITYPTAEHWMMAEKARLFDDVESVEKIVQAKSPSEAKSLGRLVKRFDSRSWDQKKIDIVKQGSYEKFLQNPEICKYLLSTENLILVESSPRDCVWGIGLTGSHRDATNPILWLGDNLLGFSLMHARDKLMRLRISNE